MESPSPTPENPIPPQPLNRPELLRSPSCVILSIGCVGTLLLIVVFFIFVSLQGINALGNVTAFIQGFIENFSQPTQATVTSSQTIVTRILPLGQLVSVSVQVAQADILIEVEQSTANVCGFSANHVAQGTIEAGIDLTVINEQDASYDIETNTYTLNLPPARLTSCSVDSRQYDRSTTLCSVDWDEARLLAEYTALRDFRDDALEGGILTRAEQQARLVLTSFISGLTDANVIINFRTEADNTLPGSCDPVVPQGWSYDDEENRWSRED